MDRAEVADRIRREGQVRLDVLRYKAGRDFAPRIQKAGLDALPRFFFAPEAVPHLCAKLREMFPVEAKRIVERAEQICLHRFDLLGFESLDYGSRIDWHCDRVHGKSAPRRPWHRIDYLDCEEVGDSKVTWELNRHQHLVTLAKAFRLNGDPKFVQEIFSQWEHWHAENPYPIGINWASSLEVAFRSLSWIWMYYLLADSAVMPTNFRPAWLRSLGVSGRHIELYLSTYFSPNTHLLGEAVALLFIGTLCPEISSAGRWQQRGWEIIQQQAKRQVRMDGLHFEQAIYYHVYALDFFLHAMMLASANQIPVPSTLEGTIERMLDALAIVSRNGPLPRFGDDDGGRVFDPARNLAAHLIDPLVTGAVLFGRGDFKRIAGGLREETLWLLGEPGVDEFNRIAGASPARESTTFAQSGIYVMSGAESGRLVIDAGPFGEGSAGHGHADALSITATLNGRDWLIDSGTFEYVGERSERDLFRGTAAHNTLTVDGLDQADPNGPFAWENLPRVTAQSWIPGKSFDYFAGRHDGYKRLPDPAIHRRSVFSLKAGLWLVRDLVEGIGEHQLDVYWHVAPGFREHASQKGYFAAQKEGVRILTVDDGDWKRSLEQRPHSPVYGRREDHSVLHFSAKAHLPAELVTLFVPSVAAESSQGKLTRIGGQDSEAAGYSYRAANAEHFFFFGDGTRWSLNGWSSDAEFLFVGPRAEPNSGQRIICCNFTRLEWNRQKLIQATRSIERLEITGPEKAEAVSSDPEALHLDAATWKALAAIATTPDDFRLT